MCWSVQRSTHLLLVIQLTYYTFYLMVCSTGVEEVLMRDEFAKLFMALVQGAATCFASITSNNYISRIRFKQLLQNYDYVIFPFRNSLMPMSIMLF